LKRGEKRDLGSIMSMLECLDLENLVTEARVRRY
jgi:hypothetical protein